MPPNTTAPYNDPVRKLSENLKHIEQRIAQACARCGRSASSVTLVAVTKYASLDLIRTLVDLGVQNLGENRGPELARRAAMVKEWLSRKALGSESTPGPIPLWHMVGHVQRNKVKALLPWVDVIHSLDSLRLAEELDLEAGKLNRRTPVLLEVNATGEGQKHGIAFAAGSHLAEQVQSLKNLELRGLMAMGPLTEDKSAIAHTFNRVRELYEEIISLRICGPSFRDLSMGMSSDFELAIEAGATMVRIGSALFQGIDLGPPPDPVEEESLGHGR